MSDRAKRKYPKMEYHYAGDLEVLRDPLVGSVIRALGKGWKVTLVAQDEGWDFWHDFSDLWNSQNLQVRQPQEDLSGAQLVLIDQSINVLKRLAIQNSEQILGKVHVMSAGEYPEDAPYNLLSHFELSRHHLKGVQAFVGSGKGKTTSALGWAWQKASGKPVAVVQWFKEKSRGHLTWSISEHFAHKHLKNPSLLTFHASGLGFFGSPALDRVKGEEAYQHHREQALGGVALASQLLHEGKIGALVLDEFVDTLLEVSGNLPQDLLMPSEVRALLHDAVQSGIPVAVSGRKVTPLWEEYVANVVRIENLRHPWTHEKRAAVSGLDF